MDQRISEAVARPVRTAVQAVPSFVITEFVDAFFYDLNDKQYAALAGFLLLVFGYLQVLLENAKGVGFLRNVPPVTVPVVDGDTPADEEIETDGPVNVSAPDTDSSADAGDEFPDMLVGEPVEPEHDLDLDTFKEGDK